MKRMRAEMYKGRTDTEWGRIRAGLRAPDLCPGIDAAAELRAVLADQLAPAILRKLAKKDLADQAKRI